MLDCETPVILDGGLATQLESMGHDIGGELWSASLLASDPRAIVNAHRAYLDAGADVIFPEAMNDEKEFEQIRKNSKTYLLANMTEFGKSKILSANQLENLGYSIVIYPDTTQRLAMKSVEDGLKVIFKDGHQNNIIDKMQTRKRLYELVEYEKYNTPDKKITDFKTDKHE